MRPYTGLHRPRTKGFSLVAAQLEGGLLDLTFVQGPGSGPPSLQSLLTGRGVDTRVFVREFRLTEVPRGEAESGAWLHRLFRCRGHSLLRRREKDDIKAAFYAGDWDRLAQLGSFKPRYHSMLTVQYYTLVTAPCSRYCR